MHHHPCAHLSDEAIDTLVQKKDRGVGRVILALLGTLIVAIVVITCAPSNSLTENLAGMTIIFSIMGLFGIGMCMEEDERLRLDTSNEKLDQAMAVLKNSLAARQLRDEILASGRSLRVFDLHAFRAVHAQALHQQKIQQVKTMA